MDTEVECISFKSSVTYDMSKLKCITPMRMIVYLILVKLLVTYLYIYICIILFINVIN